MMLSEFLILFNASESNIICIAPEDALEAVKCNGYALQYVKEQTEAVCLEAVKRNGYALRYVDKNIFFKPKV